MFLRFALCLSPLVLMGLAFLFFGEKIANLTDPGGVIGLMILFLLCGASLSGFYVARLVFRGISEPVWLKWLVASLVFSMVATGYTGFGFFGGCLLLFTTAQ